MGTAPLTLTPLAGLPIIRTGDDLGRLLLDAVNSAGITLLDGDILVVAQKIVSKAEGRMVNLSGVTPSVNAQQLALETGKDSRLVELILQESSSILRVRDALIVVEHRLGFVCANAGIDHSNVRGDSGDPKDWVLLLPENPDASAEALVRRIQEETGARIGALIIDSHGRAWRLGIIGTTIGLSGVPGVVDLRGEPDLYGYQLQVTQVAAADELAGAASLLMGQAAEGIPAVHVRGFPYPLRESSLQELIRPKNQDLFR